MSCLRQIAKHALTAMLPRDIIVSRGTGEGIALTFDDGPHPEFTPHLLDALKAAGISSFNLEQLPMLGTLIKKEQDLQLIQERVTRRGHWRN